MPLWRWGTTTKKRKSRINCVELTKYWGSYIYWQLVAQSAELESNPIRVNTTTDLLERLEWVSNPSNEISGAGQFSFQQQKSWGGSACHLDLTERICMFSPHSRSHLKWRLPRPLLSPPLAPWLSDFPWYFLLKVSELPSRRQWDPDSLMVTNFILSSKLCLEVICQYIILLFVTETLYKTNVEERNILAHTFCLILSPLCVPATLSTARPLPPLSHLFFCWLQSLTRFSQIYSI